MEELLAAMEVRASDMLDKAKTSDEALRAAGAFSLLKFAGAEIENEVQRQAEVSRAHIAKLNAR